MAKLTKEKTFAGLKIIAKYLEPHKKVVFILSVLSVFVATANAATPYLVGRIIDGILSPQNTIGIFYYPVSSAIFFVSFWFLIVTISNIFDGQLTLKRENLSTVLMGEYIIKGFGHLIELPLSFHKKNKIGEVGNRIHRAADSLEGIVSNVVVPVTPQLLSILIALVIAFFIKPLLAAILSAMILIFIFIAGIFYLFLFYLLAYFQNRLFPLPARSRHLSL